jgi:hypothetical protein
MMIIVVVIVIGVVVIIIVIIVLIKSGNSLDARKHNTCIYKGKIL